MAAHADAQCKTVGVVMFNTLDPAGTLPTSDAYRKTVFTDPESVNAVYQHNTYGQKCITGALRPDGDVFGPYTVPYYQSNGDGTYNCTAQYFNWSANAAGQAAADGYVAANYDVTIYTFSASLSPNGGCQGKAWTFNGNSALWNANTYTAAFLTHEFLHTRAEGIEHSNYWNCTTGGVKVVISATCTEVVYGDAVLMSSGSLYSLSAFHRAAVGVLTPTVVTTNGTYTIYPLELTPSALRIARPGYTNQSYWVETRIAWWWDAYAQSDARVNGIQIRVAPSGYTLSADKFTTTKLLDKTPLDAHTDAAWVEGESFTDGTITIHVDSVTKTRAIVTISGL